MESLMQIAELNPYSRGVNLKVHVISKGQETEVVSRKDGSVYRVAEALIGDPSACVLMSLWNETIAMVEEGANYQITDAYVTVFKNSMRLNLGRNGTMEKIDEEVQANQDMNMSEKRYESQFKPRRDSFKERNGYEKRRY